MNYETILRVNRFFLILAVIVLVALLVLYYIEARENSRKQAFIEKQDMEIKRLTAKLKRMGKEEEQATLKNVASEMLDDLSIEEAVKIANEHYERVKERLTAELWRQHHERCARGQECTKK